MLDYARSAKDFELRREVVQETLRELSKTLATDSDQDTLESIANSAGAIHLEGKGLDRFEHQRAYRKLADRLTREPGLKLIEPFFNGDLTNALVSGLYTDPSSSSFALTTIEASSLAALTRTAIDMPESERRFVSAHLIIRALEDKQVSPADLRFQFDKRCRLVQGLQDFISLPETGVPIESVHRQKESVEQDIGALVSALRYRADQYEVARFMRHVNFPRTTTYFSMEEDKRLRCIMEWDGHKENGRYKWDDITQAFNRATGRSVEKKKLIDWVYNTKRSANGDPNYKPTLVYGPSNEMERAIYEKITTLVVQPGYRYRRGHIAWEVITHELNEWLKKTHPDQPPRKTDSVSALFRRTIADKEFKKTESLRMEMRAEELTREKEALRQKRLETRRLLQKLPGIAEATAAPLTPRETILALNMKHGNFYTEEQIRFVEHLLSDPKLIHTTSHNNRLGRPKWKEIAKRFDEQFKTKKSARALSARFLKSFEEKTQN